VISLRRSESEACAVLGWERRFGGSGSDMRVIQTSTSLSITNIRFPASTAFTRTTSTSLLSVTKATPLAHVATTLSYVACVKTSITTTPTTRIDGGHGS
jgi:hypothetical protein